ncbi:asparaginyl-tRNA synthetase [Trifolium repens]|nr:asparaginyl-tRNA synthetase [Trifolium repens]
MFVFVHLQTCFFIHLKNCFLISIHLKIQRSASSYNCNVVCFWWSLIERVAAKYLQTLFDKEDLHGRQNLHLENILAGKTRKEASRMFFETLVLKTRDYVQVEQPKPFGNIILQPRTKLMKTDF